MSELIIDKADNNYLQIYSSPDVEQELADYFTITIPNAHFRKNKSSRLKKWNGTIRLYDMRSKKLLIGLLERVEQFASERNYKIRYAYDASQYVLDEDAFKKMIERLKLPNELRDYQYTALVETIKSGRKTIISPTGSGKSLIIYVLCMYYLINKFVDKILIIVPTINLVNQMASDFVSYGCSESIIHKIFYGQDHNTNRPITISTWQSIFNLDQTYYTQYHMVIGDECHLYDSNTFKSIHAKTEHVNYKIGLTGTLHDALTHRLVIEGTFGSVHTTETTKNLIDQGYLSPLKINVIVFKYPLEVKKMVSLLDYADENTFIESHKGRMAAIVKLAGRLDRNALVLFKSIDHGKALHEQIKTHYPDKDVRLVYGLIPGQEREEIRKLAEHQNNLIIVASYKTFSTGVSINNLHYIVFAGFYKSKIKILQSIGRGLRLHANKEKVVIYDIADDFRTIPSKLNYSLAHLVERIKIYIKEKFPHATHNIELTNESNLLQTSDPN